VIGFWNDEILNQIEVVLESIVQALENQLVQFTKEPSCKGSTPHPDRVGGASQLRPLTPPYVRCRIWRFKLNFYRCRFLIKIDQSLFLKPYIR
jgi:hypothetical protein